MGTWSQTLSSARVWCPSGQRAEGTRPPAAQGRLWWPRCLRVTIFDGTPHVRGRGEGLIQTRCRKGAGKGGWGLGTQVSSAGSWNRVAGDGRGQGAAGRQEPLGPVREIVGVTAGASRVQVNRGRRVASGEADLDGRTWCRLGLARVPEVQTEATRRCRERSRALTGRRLRVLPRASALGWSL